MWFDESILIGFGIMIAIYFVYRMLSQPSSIDNEYDKLYDKIMTSEEYKVKGQHEK